MILYALVLTWRRLSVSCCSLYVVLSFSGYFNWGKSTDGQSTLGKSILCTYFACERANDPVVVCSLAEVDVKRQPNIVNAQFEVMFVFYQLVNLRTCNNFVQIYKFLRNSLLQLRNRRCKLASISYKNVIRRTIAYDDINTYIILLRMSPCVMQLYPFCIPIDKKVAKNTLILLASVYHEYVHLLSNDTIRIQSIYSTKFQA